MRESAQTIISRNLALVRDRMAQAAERSGRSPSSVRLIAVTKYVPLDQTRVLLDAGCQDLGESRPQDLWPKAESLSVTPVRWHFIGHLQRNKLAKTLPLVHLLHSIDSLRLLQAIDQWAATQQTIVHGLLEINISGDANKHGFAPAETAAALKYASSLSHVRIRGLMGMASLEGGTDQARRDFIALRELRDRMSREFPDGPALSELSMGMSHDYVEAIEEGATLVRVGSALFEGVEMASGEPSDEPSDGRG